MQNRRALLCCRAWWPERKASQAAWLGNCKPCQPPRNPTSPLCSHHCPPFSPSPSRPLPQTVFWRLLFAIVRCVACQLLVRCIKRPVPVCFDLRLLLSTHSTTSNSLATAISEDSTHLKCSLSRWSGLPPLRGGFTLHLRHSTAASTTATNHIHHADRAESPHNAIINHPRRVPAFRGSRERPRPSVQGRRRPRAPLFKASPHHLHLFLQTNTARPGPRVTTTFTLTHSTRTRTTLHQPQLNDSFLQWSLVECFRRQSRLHESAHLNQKKRSAPPHAFCSPVAQPRLRTPCLLRARAAEIPRTSIR